jgi:hypothetical protein
MQAARSRVARATSASPADSRGFMRQPAWDRKSFAGFVGARIAAACLRLAVHNLPSISISAKSRTSEQDFLSHHANARQTERISLMCSTE